MSIDHGRIILAISLALAGTQLVCYTSLSMWKNIRGVNTPELEYCEGCFNTPY